MCSKGSTCACERPQKSSTSKGMMPSTRKTYDEGGQIGYESAYLKPVSRYGYPFYEWAFRSDDPPPK